jgi:hypothetical protein
MNMVITAVTRQDALILRIRDMNAEIETIPSAVNFEGIFSRRIQDSPKI